MNVKAPLIAVVGVTVIEVAEFTLKGTFVPPIDTEVTELKFVPLIVKL